MLWVSRMIVYRMVQTGELEAAPHKRSERIRINPASFHSCVQRGAREP
jgi:hypothetical protein